MARGYGLLVGLNSINSAVYGWDGKNGCLGCELDVDNIARILEPLDYSVSILKTREATASNVLLGLRSAARILKSGDIFVFFFAGHGSQQPDFDGDEQDGQDETLLLYDREVVDDELGPIWKEFRPGVRIVMISDSCNSGTNYRGFRDVPIEKAQPLQMRPDRNTGMRAQMIHYSGCRDGWSSAGYESGGAFTSALCKTWANGRFAGTYPLLHKQTSERLSNVGEQQQPQYSKYGNVTAEFEDSHPFSIETMRMPTKEEISDAVGAIPVSWLHSPTLANQDGTETLRIEPFTAALVGVVVGAGTQLASQALTRIDSSDRADISNVCCRLSISEIKQRADVYARSIRAGQLKSIAESEGRALPVAVAAFLAGVATGAAAARSDRADQPQT